MRCVFILFPDSLPNGGYHCHRDSRDKEGAHTHHFRDHLRNSFIIYFTFTKERKARELGTNQLLSQRHKLKTIHGIQSPLKPHGSKQTFHEAQRLTEIPRSQLVFPYCLFEFNLLKQFYKAQSTLQCPTIFCKDAEAKLHHF